MTPLHRLIRGRHGIIQVSQTTTMSTLNVGAILTQGHGMHVPARIRRPVQRLMNQTAHNSCTHGPLFIGTVRRPLHQHQGPVNLGTRRHTISVRGHDLGRPHLLLTLRLLTHLRPHRLRLIRNNINLISLYLLLTRHHMVNKISLNRHNLNLLRTYTLHLRFTLRQTRLTTRLLTFNIKGTVKLTTQLKLFNHDHHNANIGHTNLNAQHARKLIFNNNITRTRMLISTTKRVHRITIGRHPLLINRTLRRRTIIHRRGRHTQPTIRRILSGHRRINVRIITKLI